MKLIESFIIFVNAIELQNSDKFDFSDNLGNSNY